MRSVWGAIAGVTLLFASVAQAENVTVSIDVSAATAVLGAVRNAQLTTGEALIIARLPGNQGLIRKAKSYGRTATDDLFAKALLAAAHRDSAFVDISRFRFDDVRDHAALTEQALAGLGDARLHLVDTVKKRIVTFTPATLTGRITGYLVVGGTSGGFAFGDPQFYLNLEQFPSALLASTIMSHELFHAVQALAQSARKPSPEQGKCIAGTAHAGEVADFLGSLSAEGTASYVGDVLSIPEHGADDPSLKERARFARNLGLVNRSVTQLELSIHGLTTGAEVSPDAVYELGFYGDEVMYALGYVMARAIAKEQGDAAIGDLIGLPGAAFVERYVHLKGYGRTDEMPALKPATIRWADRLTSCSGQA
jgi:hypothetical protein